MSIFGNAKYIKAAEKASDFSLCDPIPFFRREFKVDLSSVGKAEIYVQSPGFAEFFINGEPITADKFISPLSDYSRILWYHVYDVTALFREGKNTLGVIASNGYFNESFKTAWNFQLAAWRDAPQFIACLKINGVEALVSDGSWKASTEASHIIFSHLRSGEYVDMRKFDGAWMRNGYDDSVWNAAIERTPSEITGKFMRTECPPVCEAEALSPVSVTEVKSGYLVDFGKNSSGYMEITLTAPRGTEVIFRYCEEVDTDGAPKHNRMDMPPFYPESAFQVNKLIASGGVDVFKPKFSYHGFRYVVIEGLPYKPSIDDMRAYFTHNDVKRKADFTSGNEIINFIYTAGIRSSYSNMFWSLTDCPTREKLGWTNDAQASAEQMLINFDMLPFYKKWFTDTLADQQETGELHGVIPTWGWGLDWGPVCDYFLFEIPYRVYLYTGDASMLTEAIPYFERYRDFLKKAISKNKEFRLGDWTGSGNSNVIPKEFIRGIYLVKVLKTLAEARRIAGLSYVSEEKELSDCREDFLNTYLGDDGRCVIDQQTSCAMMIVLGLFRDKTVITDQLVRAVERDGARLTSGMVGVQYLYDALSECGHARLAYKIITESSPGYRTWYENGATTLWEIWDGKDRCSHNHHMYSNVIAWFFKSLLGISPCEDAPAFLEVRIRPQFIRELTFVKGYEDTPRGRIEAEWRYEDGAFTYTVTLPKGVRAEYRGQKLSAGKNRFVIRESE